MGSFKDLNASGMQTKTPFVLLSILLLLGEASRAPGRVIQNDDPQFTLEVPPGFEQIPAPQLGSPPTVYMFVIRGPRGALPDAAVGVQLLGGTIGTQPPELPANTPAGAYLTKARWQGYDVDVVVSRINQSGVTLACRTAQIPLRGQAIQLVVAMPPERESTADAILAKFLAGLDGPSNWPPPVSDEDQRAYHSRRLATAIALPLLVIAIVFLRINRRRRAKRRGQAPRPVRISKATLHPRALKTGAKVAGLAFLLLCVDDFLVFYLGYAAPITDDNAEQRSYDLTMGTCKLSIFCGLIGYVISIVRGTLYLRRHPVPPPPTTPAPPNTNWPIETVDPADALANIRDDAE
jgi:hypothetical protein